MKTIDIAIPAYNEERVIDSILWELSKQQSESFLIRRILVYSDASTDNTEDIVRTHQKNDKRIRLIRIGTRLGKIQLLNRIFRDVTADYVAVLDADLSLSNTRFIHDALAPFLSDPKAGMIAIHTIPLPAHTLFGAIIHADFTLWDYVRLSDTKNTTVHSFYGQATIYARWLSTHISIPKEAGTDERGYLYLLAQRYKALRYSYNNPAWYRLPETIRDTLIMMKRPFGKHRDYLIRLFGNRARLVYTMPKQHVFNGTLKALRKNPVLTVLSLAVNRILSVVAQYGNAYSGGIWEQVSSTKRRSAPFAQKQKIIFSSYDDRNNPHYGGGGAKAIHEIARRLSSSYQVTVLTGSYPKAKNCVVDGVTYTRIGPSFAGPWIGQIIFLLILPYYVLTKQFDCWIESLTPPFGSLWLSAWTNKPVIALVHMLPAADMKRKYKLPFDLVERSVIQNRRYAIAPTPYFQSIISRINPKCDCVVIPNGMSNHQRTQTVRPLIHRPYWLYLGRLEVNQKGLDLLFSAYKEIPSQKRLPLVIAGNGDARSVSYVRRFAETFPSVHVLGRVSERHLPSLYTRAVATVVPSRFETFSLTALDSLSYGVPVVRFSIEGLSWIPKGCGVTVPPFEYRELANALGSYQKPMPIPKSVQKNLHETYNWDTSGNRYYDYIQHVLFDARYG